MASFFLRPFRQLAQALTGNDSPRQVAAGFTLGMLVGLLPKGNLMVVVLATLLFALRVNWSAGLLAIGIFSFVALPLDGLAHQLGSLVLVWEPLRPVYVWLYELPLGPWLGLNNTAVVGHLLLGLYFAYPAYCYAEWFAKNVQPRLGSWLLSYRAIRWLRGAELGTQWGADS